MDFLTHKPNNSGSVGRVGRVWVVVRCETPFTSEYGRRATTLPTLPTLPSFGLNINTNHPIENPHN